MQTLIIKSRLASSLSTFILSKVLKIQRGKEIIPEDLQSTNNLVDLKLTQKFLLKVTTLEAQVV